MSVKIDSRVSPTKAKHQVFPHAAAGNIRRFSPEITALSKSQLTNVTGCREAPKSDAVPDKN